MLVKLNDQRPKSFIDWNFGVSFSFVFFFSQCNSSWRCNRQKYIIFILSLNQNCNLVLFGLFYDNFFNYTDFRHLMTRTRKTNIQLSIHRIQQNAEYRMHKIFFPFFATFTSDENRFQLLFLTIRSTPIVFEFAQTCVTTFAPFL